MVTVEIRNDGKQCRDMEIRAFHREFFNLDPFHHCRRHTPLRRVDQQVTDSLERKEMREAKNDLNPEAVDTSLSFCDPGPLYLGPY